MSPTGKLGRLRPSRGDVEWRLRQTLPRPAYQELIGAYESVRGLAGRNPGRGHLLPDFVIIGAAKAGTTSLYHWLSRHPYVAPASTKEVHYFDYNYFRGEDWYRRHFVRQGDRDRFAAEHGRPFLTGEASPSYMSHFWAPQRLARLLPDVRMLVTLRDPVDRAHSQFQMSRREQEEPLESFADAAAAEEERLVPERARAFADQRYNSWPIGCWSYLMRSRYAEQIERWFTFFPREQFHFVTLDELSQQPQRALDDIHEFLGLPPHAYSELQPRHGAAYDALDPETRARLNDYFRPHNEHLYELVGIDFGWERQSVSSASV
jgi:hypothetical protein